MSKYLAAIETPGGPALQLGQRYEVYYMPDENDRRVILKLVGSNSHPVCRTCGNVKVSERDQSIGSCWSGASGGFNGLRLDLDFCGRWKP